MIVNSFGLKGKYFLILKELSMPFYPKLYKPDIKTIKISLIYLLDLTKTKTKLYSFPQNNNNYDWKPNFKHLYLAFHK